MNKKIYILIISVLLVVTSGCNISKNQDNTDESMDLQAQGEKLSTSIEKLISQEIFDLKIKQTSDNYYPATEEFTMRLIEEIEDYEIAKPPTDKKKPLEVVLKFKGFEKIYLDTQNGYFWFDNSEKIYIVKNWNSTLWDRYVLKENNDQVMYDTFEKDILLRNNTSTTKRAKEDEVLLYYDGDIRLKYKGQEVEVIPNVSENCIESTIASNQMVNQLLIKENSEENGYFFLVGSTYSFTSKYGSTAWLSCYEYKDDMLKKTWDMNDFFSSTIKVKDYDEEFLTLSIVGQNIEMKMKLTKDETNIINDYRKFLDEMGEQYIGRENYMFFSNFTKYEFADYNNDGKEDLIAETYMRGGASGITEIIYFVYDFNEDGIQLMDGFTKRENSEVNLLN
ncbi:MAG: hypothetical protein FH761_14955 [Firmicutes bacterium]|nr:hypothetical protein [Bacillota bacterium]